MLCLCFACAFVRTIRQQHIESNAFGHEKMMKLWRLIHNASTHKPTLTTYYIRCRIDGIDAWVDASQAEAGKDMINASLSLFPDYYYYLCLEFGMDLDCEVWTTLICAQRESTENGNEGNEEKTHSPKNHTARVDVAIT